MIDFQPWLDEWSRYSAADWIPGWWVVLAVLCGVVIVVDFARMCMADRTVSVLSPVGLTACLVVFGLMFGPTVVHDLSHGTEGGGTTPASFAERTESEFHVSRFQCHIPDYAAHGGVTGYHDCAESVLPADKTPAEWIDGDGNLVEGHVLVDGSKVGLADGAGRLVLGRKE